MTITRAWGATEAASGRKACDCLVKALASSSNVDMLPKGSGVVHNRRKEKRDSKREQWKGESSSAQFLTM